MVGFQQSLLIGIGQPRRVALEFTHESETVEDAFSHILSSYTNYIRCIGKSYKVRCHLD